MKLKNIIVLPFCIFISHASFAGASFERSVGEIQVLSDRVRMNIGVTYGTCGAAEGWWGWSINNGRHKDWLSLALSAQAQGKKVVVIDDHGSCSGPSADTIGLEGMSIKP